MFKETFSAKTVNEPEKKAELIPSPDQAGVIMAENIALAKEEIVQKIFTEDLPVSQWEKAVQDILLNHPDLTNYKHLFLETTHNTYNANEAINKFWSDYAKNETISSDALYQANNYVEADEISAQNIFQTIFKQSPEKPVKAIKGIKTLILEVFPADLKKITRDSGDNISEGCFYQKNDFPNLPVIVLLQESHDKLMNMRHEVQHLNYNFERSAAFSYINLDIPPNDALPSEIKKHQERLSLEKYNNLGIIENRAKDEILAFASYLELLELNIYCSKQQKCPINMDETDLFKMKNNYLLSVASTLADEHGDYYQKYCQRGPLANLDSKIKQAYQQHVRASVAAYQELSEIYENSFSPNIFRMTIDVLSQFPLVHWPAVVRLIKQRRQKTKS